MSGYHNEMHEENSASKSECLFNAEMRVVEITVDNKLYDSLKSAVVLDADIFSCRMHLHLVIRHHNTTLVLGLCKTCTSVLDNETHVPLIVSNASTLEHREIILHLSK